MASLAPLDIKVDPLQSNYLPPPSSLSSFSPSPSSPFDVTPTPKNTSGLSPNNHDTDTMTSPVRPSIYPIPQEGHRIVDGSEFGSEEYELEKSDPTLSSSISSRNRVTLGKGGTLAAPGRGEANASPQSSNYPDSRKALLESSAYSMSSSNSSTGSLSDQEPKTSLINPMETPLNPDSIPHPKLSKVGPYLTISALQAYTVMTVVRCLADPTWIVLKSSQDKTGGGQEDPYTLKLGLIGKKERIWLSLAIGFSILNSIGVTMRIMDRMTRMRKIVVVSTYLQAGFCIAAVTSFLRTHELPPGAQYSHGFLSCVMTMVFSFIIALMLSWDWWRGFPSAGLSATLKALIVSSFVTTAVILVGATIYTRLEGWTFDQSVNFCIVSFATIGYGNISPKSIAGRVIFFFYGLLGISAIGFFIVSLRNAIIEQFQWRLVDRFSRPAHMSRVQTRMSAKDLSYPMARFEEEQRVKLLVKRKMIVRMVVIWIVLWFGGAGVFCAFEEWTYIESLYFCFVTLTTIGFGDYVPEEPGSIEFWNIYVFIGLTVFAYILSLFSESMASHIHLVDDVDDDEDGDGLYGWEQCEDPNAPLTTRSATLGLEGLKWAQSQQMPYRGPLNQKDASLPSALHQPGPQANSDRKQGGVHFLDGSLAPQQPSATSTATDSPGHPLADTDGNTAPPHQSIDMPQQLRFKPKRRNSSGRILMVSAKERKQMLQAEYYATHGGPPMANGAHGDADTNGNNSGVSETHGASQGGMMASAPATIKFVDMYGIPHQRVVGRRTSLISNGATGPGADPDPSMGPHKIPYGHDGGGPLPQYTYGTTGYFDDLARRRRGTVAPIHVPGMAAAAEEARRQQQGQQSHPHHHHHHYGHHDQSKNEHAGGEKIVSHHDGTQHQHSDGADGGGGMVGAHQQLQEGRSTPPPLQTNILQHQPQVKFESPRSSPRGGMFPPRIPGMASPPIASRFSQESQGMAGRHAPGQDQSAPPTSPSSSMARSMDVIPPSLDLHPPLSKGLNATSKQGDPIVTEGAGRLMPWPEEAEESMEPMTPLPKISLEALPTSSRTDGVAPDNVSPTSGHRNKGGAQDHAPSPLCTPSSTAETSRSSSETAASSGIRSTVENRKVSHTSTGQSLPLTTDSINDVGPFNEIRDPEAIPPFDDDTDLNSTDSRPGKKTPPLSDISRTHSPRHQPPPTNIVQQERPPPPASASSSSLSRSLFSTPLNATSANTSLDTPPRQGPPLTKAPSLEPPSRPAVDLGDTGQTNAPASMADTTAPPPSSRSSSIATTISIGPFDEIRDAESIATFDVDVDLNHLDPDPQQVLEAKSSRKEMKRRQKAIEAALEESEKDQDDQKSGQHG